MGFSESMESLKGFDVNDLDFNNAGSWPAPIKAIVLILVFALLIFGGYWFLIKDQYVQLDKVVSEEATLKQKYETKAYKVANIKAFRQQMDEMQKTFGALLKQLPADTEVPGLLEDITNTGLGSGLEIDSIKLQKEALKDFYVELPMDITVSGTYHDLASFVSGVASLPRIVTLHDFEIKPFKGGESTLGSGALKMRISAKTYRYSGETEKKPKKKGKKKGKKRGKKK